MEPCNDDTLTLAKLKQLIADMPKPHPLSGITTVYYAENMRDAAIAFVEEYNKTPRLGMPAIAVLSPYLPPGHIVGMRGGDVVMLAGPERKKPPEADPGRRFGILSGADYT